MIEFLRGHMPARSRYKKEALEYSKREAQAASIAVDMHMALCREKRRKSDAQRATAAAIPDCRGCGAPMGQYATTCAYCRREL